MEKPTIRSKKENNQMITVIKMETGWDPEHK
jgi:hypothetical protein